MEKTMKVHPTTQSQSEGKDEPEIILDAPQEGGQPDAAVGEDMADSKLEVDYEGSETKNEPVAQYKGR